MTRNQTLPPQARREAIAALNQTVIELFDLFACIRQAHWNTRGVNSIKLDELAGHIMGHIYHAVERATVIGALADENFRESVKQSSLAKEKEMPSSLSSFPDWIKELADLHSIASEHVRQAMRQLIDVQDFSSADLLADVLRTLETHLWVLEAHLKQQPLKN